MPILSVVSALNLISTSAQPISRGLATSDPQGLVGEQDETWEPLASTRATGMAGDEHSGLQGSGSVAYRKEFMDYLGQWIIPANINELAFLITLKSVGIALNCLVLTVSGCAVSQGPTRGNL